ncbi:uncharacterized protein EI90DRAFT_3044229 [Cantharellus anzutake]|uniref:uncharacterized protein n=1 Tax=Cantharellus anzutake TaxID=1750568 RepID=UPI001906F5A2|nr:uncharacterized protein EI90DRAFT_3044229 [Cantharellus anzutake]KAF8336934.1 hypothetical protein EI90DRAFT_3044229 [Cantharellus anzutake]
MGPVSRKLAPDTTSTCSFSFHRLSYKTLGRLLMSEPRYMSLRTFPNPTFQSSIMSFAHAATPDTRGTTAGCLVCDLRGEICLRPPGSHVCIDCQNFRVQCHGQGPTPVEMKSHYSYQTAREEIYEAINNVNFRTTHDPLPATKRFSDLLEQAKLGLANTLLVTQAQYQGTPPCWQSGTSTRAASFASASGIMESTPFEPIPEFALPLFPAYTSNPILDFDSMPEPGHVNSMTLLDGAPDHVVYFGNSSLSGTTEQNMHNSEEHPHHLSPLTPACLNPCAASSQIQPDIHVIIESLRPFLWHYGYKLVRVK